MYKTERKKLQSGFFLNGTEFALFLKIERSCGHRQEIGKEKIHISEVTGTLFYLKRAEDRIFSVAFRNCAN